jgi:hypothetical protein
MRDPPFIEKEVNREKLITKIQLFNEGKLITKKDTFCSGYGGRTDTISNLHNVICKV